MAESPKQGEGERLQNFEEIVDWCRSNGFTDFDFEGLERRVLELAKAMRSPAEEEASGSAAGAARQPSSRLIPFKKNFRRRDS